MSSNPLWSLGKVWNQRRQCPLSCNTGWEKHLCNALVICTEASKQGELPWVRAMSALELCAGRQGWGCACLGPPKVGRGHAVVSHGS